MAIIRILAQMTVADLTVATQWYSRLFGTLGRWKA